MFANVLLSAILFRLRISTYRFCALSVRGSRQCDDPRLRMRIRTWDARRSLHDDGRAYRGQPLRVRALRPVHESVRNCEHALPIHFESLKGPIQPITEQAVDKLLPFTCIILPHKARNEI